MSDHPVWVGFSTTNKFMSRLIRWVTKGKCSHAWVRYWDATLERYMVMQAEITGYETIPWERWKKKNILVAAYEPTGKNLLNGVRFMSQYLGEAYDLKAAIWVGLKRWISRKFRRPFNSPKKLMCSEAVTRALQHDDFKCVEGVDPEVISPTQLRHRVEQSTELKQVA